MIRLAGEPRSPASSLDPDRLDEGRIDMGEKVIIDIETFLDGHAPPDKVHPAML